MLPQLLGGNCTFVVGYDTCLRLLQSKYYSDSSVHAALSRLQARPFVHRFAAHCKRACDASASGRWLFLQSRRARDRCVLNRLWCRAIRLCRQSRPFPPARTLAASHTAVCCRAVHRNFRARLPSGRVIQPAARRRRRVGRWTRQTVKASRLSHRHDCATKTTGSCAAVQHSFAGHLAGSCAPCATSSHSLMKRIIKRATLAALGRTHLAVEEQRFIFTHAHVLGLLT